MATFGFNFYDAAPLAVFTTTTHGISIYTGPSTADGTATITDEGPDLKDATQSGIVAGPTAKADVTINGRSSIGSRVDAERSWTLRDTVTDKAFQVVEFDVEDFDAQGIYLLSEEPLVTGRTYETLGYDSLPNPANGDPAFSYETYAVPTSDQRISEPFVEDDQSEIEPQEEAGQLGPDDGLSDSDDGWNDIGTSTSVVEMLDGNTDPVPGYEDEDWHVATSETPEFAAPQQPEVVETPDPKEDAQDTPGISTLVDGTIVNFSEIESIICFTHGTLIDTVDGPRPIEDIAVGDLVMTLDRGPMPVRWHGSRTVSATKDLAPVRFEEGTLGNTRALLVSPQHRMLIKDHRAQLHFGEMEVLVPAKALIDGKDILQTPFDQVTYHHLLLDWHAVLTAEGAAAESYHPGAYSLEGLEDRSREDLFRVFPVLRSDPGLYGPMARPTITAKAGSVLAA